MHRTILFIALAGFVATSACSGGQSSKHRDDTADSTAGNPAGGASMSSFDKALAHFRKAAAQRLNQPESKLWITPDAANQVGLPDFALPPFIAFQAEANRQVLRGLAEPGGTVALVWQGKLENLGPLLQAAQLLDPAKALPAVDIAKRITWLHGMEFFLIASGHDTWKVSANPPANTEPTLTHAGDGSAELRFFVNQAGNTGVVVAHEVVIRVAPGYQATATMNHAGP